jgi:hypothetical protein
MDKRGIIGLLNQQAFHPLLPQCSEASLLALIRLSRHGPWQERQHIASRRNAGAIHVNDDAASGITTPQRQHAIDLGVELQQIAPRKTVGRSDAAETRFRRSAGKQRRYGSDDTCCALFTIIAQVNLDAAALRELPAWRNARPFRTMR